jgi:hypothetical protein
MAAEVESVDEGESVARTAMELYMKAHNAWGPDPQLLRATDDDIRRAKRSFGDWLGEFVDEDDLEEMVQASASQVGSFARKRLPWTTGQTNVLASLHFEALRIADGQVEHVDFSEITSKS